jgi:adenylate cyclase
VVAEQDLHSTPLYFSRLAEQDSSRRLPGVLIHAYTITTLLDEKFIQGLTEENQFLLVILTSILVTGIAFRFPPLTSTVITVGGLVALTTLAIGPIFRMGLWVLLVSPILAASLAFVSSQTLNFLLEGREKRTLKRVFQRYVSGAVIEKVLQAPEESALEGERRRVAILFSDIRGFTSRSEGIPAEELVQFLNRYLTRMVATIQRNDGMVDKFMGDGIMAVFGAPIKDDQCAVKATQAASEMLEEVRKLNESLGQHPIRIGIGIHIGEAIVGNIGSPQRMEYTAIGDVVNTASRIESLNKELGTEVLMSEQVAQDISGSFRTRKVAEKTVKGKTHPLQVFTLHPPPR